MGLGLGGWGQRRFLSRAKGDGHDRDWPPICSGHNAHRDYNICHANLFDVTKMSQILKRENYKYLLVSFGGFHIPSYKYFCFSQIPTKLHLVF